MGAKYSNVMSESGDESYEKIVDKMLDDPSEKSWLLQKLGLDAEGETDKNRAPPGKDDEPRSRDKRDHHPNVKDQEPVGYQPHP